MVAPPFSEGGVQERLMMVRPDAVAMREVGAPGGVAAAVVALATLDTAPVPAELIALTR